MTTWDRPVSWSKFKEALTCPRQLQFDLDKTPPSAMYRGWHQSLGKAVQKVFELFYNQGLWQKEKTHTETVFREIARRVIERPDTYDGNSVIYDDYFPKEKLVAEIYEQVENGRKMLKEAGLLSAEMKSEHGWGATFRNLRLYGKMDFTRKLSGGIVQIYDGKGSQEKNADPRQIIFYALIVTASGLNVNRAALIYWKHGIEYIDVSLEKIKEFVETDYQRGLEIFQLLRRGIEELPAKPAPENCGWCSWKQSCKDSLYFKEGYKPEGFVELLGDSK